MCIFDPLLPIRRDRKVRRYVVISFALLCGAVGYGIANSEIVNGILYHHFRPPQCEDGGDLSHCTPALAMQWTQQVETHKDAFRRSMLYPPMLRPHCSTVSYTICSIIRYRVYRNPNVWFAQHSHAAGGWRWGC